MHTQKPPCLLWKSRHGIYYFRLVIPENIRNNLMYTRKEFRCSLNTRCPKVALYKSRSVWAMLFGDRHAMNMAKEKKIYEVKLERSLDDYEFKKSPSGTLHQLGFIDPSLQVEYLEEISAKLKGVGSGISNPEEIKEIVSSSLRYNPDVEPLPLTEVIGKYIQEKTDTKYWKGKTHLENVAIYDLFTRIVGEKTFSDIKLRDIVAYKDILMKLPANMNKDRRYRTKSIERILKMRNVQPISISTLNKHLSRISGLFSWAMQHGYTDKNYAAALQVKSKVSDRDLREIFDRQDLERLIHGNIYESAKHKSFQFWVPLIGMFTGARLGEICQLKVDDVKELDGIWCFSINDDGDDKSLKNNSSIRDVPIHSTLLKLGILNLVAFRKQNKQSQLFVELPYSERDGYAVYASKWFTRYKRRCWIDSDKKVFHSFRHTVTDHLKQKGLPMEQVSALVGHSSGTITFDRYGKKAGAKLLKDVVENIDYGLSFDHLMNPAVNEYL